MIANSVSQVLGLRTQHANVFVLFPDSPDRRQLPRAEQTGNATTTPGISSWVVKRLVLRFPSSGSGPSSCEREFRRQLTENQKEWYDGRSDKLLLSLTHYSGFSVKSNVFTPPDVMSAVSSDFWLYFSGR